MRTKRNRALAVVPATLEAAAREAFGGERMEVEVELDPSVGLGRAFEGGWEVVLLSLSVEGVDLVVVERLAKGENAPVVLVSAPGASLERALGAGRAGARGVVHEPFDAEALRDHVRKALPGGAGLPIPPYSAREESPEIIGSTEGMAAAFDVIARVAPSQATVLIRGESGTGKELVAKAIHSASDRSGGPFVAVNCAAIPEHLLESELFGHERGAFTGAVARKRGRFERASGGTLFLDEIGDMSLVLQAKILRALEEREIERLGGESRIPVDVRVIAATNRHLPVLIARGEFREDLYYRLAVVEIELPPLRERADDVLDLAFHFAGECAARYGRPVRYLAEEAVARLKAYSWPGNVRELRNVMDRAVLLARGATIQPGDLQLSGGAASTGQPAGSGGEGEGYPATLSLAQVEAAHIAAVLRETRGHMGEASQILGIHRNTLTRKLREYNLEADTKDAPDQ